MVVACLDHGEGTDPEAFGLAFHHQGPTFINACCQAATILIYQGVYCCTKVCNLHLDDSPSKSCDNRMH